MLRKWMLKMSWLHLCWVFVVTLSNCQASIADDSAHSVSDSNSKFIVSSVILSKNPLSNLSQSNDEEYARLKRAVVQSTLRLIDEKHCPEIRNLCSNLRDGSDDLPVLECVQTFLSNQIENLSDECHHTIWTHTGKRCFYVEKKI